MGRGLPAVMAVALLLPSLVQAQRMRDEEGVVWGSFRIRPVAEALGAYDNRVLVDELSGDAEGDLYAELTGALYFENLPAQYDFSAYTAYGYRFYRDYIGLDDDFYKAGVAVASSQNPLKLGVSAFLKKTLDYDTMYEVSSGQEPGAILTGNPSTRYTATANVAYERNLAGKTSIEPGYEARYYFQDFQDEDDAEWVEHRAGLRIGYDYSEKTRLFLTGYYLFQTAENEEGSIGAATLGAEGRFSGKTSWRAHVGIAAADYEHSGTDQGLVGLLRGNWEITEKLSAYIYGSSNYQPGYGGSNAREVQRLGYGANWRIVSRWRIMVQVLHDYREELDRPGGGEVGNFISAETGYDLTKRFTVGGRVRYAMDEEEHDQAVVALSAVYRY
ncbi:MAG: hypothetical protein ABFR47_06485 [Verrucomicrobiota bacterium]